ncbi:MAG: NUMOD4 domain-containing protein [Xenococcaceae cyanobacterium MO_188.B32]|nr:NUMOD4 domain-containing protein [Xenococcaceae cyanobacterium MO_188.B32]
MLEDWSHIVNFPDYQVSNHGRVKNQKTGRILKTHSNHGYLRVGLYEGKIRKYKLVHRLVAEAFIPNPENKPAVNHINGCKTDNNVSNLEWVSASENMSHAHRNGLRPKVNTKGENNGFAKLTRFTATEIKILALQGNLTQKEIATKFGVSKSTVQDIKLGRRWKHIKLQ